MELLNGNHRRAYIKEIVAAQSYQQYQIALHAQAKEQLTAREKADWNVVEKKLEQMLKSKAIWLVHFYDIGEWF